MKKYIVVMKNYKNTDTTILLTLKARDIIEAEDAAIKEVLDSGSYGTIEIYEAENRFFRKQPSLFMPIRIIDEKNIKVLSDLVKGE